MSENRKANFIVILIFLGVIMAFAYSYNSYVTTAVADAAYNDKEILQNYNNEIIKKLTSQDSVGSWSEIVEQYEDIVIVIENSSNMVVTRSIGKSWSALDVKVLTPFEFMGEAYLIKSSVYLLRDYVTDVRNLVEFIFIEFLIGLSALCLLIFIIYSYMLRHYRRLYKAIEEYDKTGKMKKVTLKGYAARVYSRFESMTRNLEVNQENQRRIIASISHDIKTPLTSIMGYAERLKRDDIPEERRQRYLDTVYGKSCEIQQLVNEFDEYLGYNMSSELNLTEVTASKLGEIILREYQEDMALVGVSINVSNAAQDTAVLIDEDKFRRVFGNIFANSAKHCVGESKKVQVDIYSDKYKLYIDISDNGEGVRQEDLEVIFEPLYTSDSGRKVAGLGLAICREIIDGHSGRIYARPSETGGLTIAIELERKDKKKSAY